MSNPHTKLKTKVERIQRRATNWILKSKPGVKPYKQRLLALNLLPLCYGREIKVLVFFYKALYEHTDLNVHDFVSFVYMFPSSCLSLP